MIHYDKTIQDVETNLLVTEKVECNLYIVNLVKSCVASLTRLLQHANHMHHFTILGFCTCMNQLQKLVCRM